ncbi:MAG: hypothetical protein JXR25_01195 [Pontiellaceae bacterium]|nr:hypothetical protein [Pontiellaceae bacterium]MBN2783415.1 hypothetical protein [Pontiellaceae bacterium]
MARFAHISYCILFLFYALFVFIAFPFFNINAAIPSIVLCGLGAWIYGSSKGLRIAFAIIAYFYFIFDYYGDILMIYQAKAFGTFTFTFVVIGIGYLKEQRDKVKTLSALLDQKVSERTEMLNQLIRQLIDDDEYIRRSLGQDIHDGLGQNLTGLLIFSNILLEEVENQGIDCISDLESIIHGVQKNLTLTRRLSRTLFPFKMIEAGLDSALDELSAYFSETTDTTFLINLDESEKELSDFNLIHFYRIVHECVLNILHHDHPKEICIVFTKQNAKFILNITATDCENPDITIDDTYIELVRYRAQLMGGELTTVLKPDNSLQIECSTSALKNEPSQQMNLITGLNHA